MIKLGVHDIQDNGQPFLPQRAEARLSALFLSSYLKLPVLSMLQ